MPSVARLGDSISGTTSGEHSGHLPPAHTPHTPSPLTGSIVTGSQNVLVNSRPVATVGSLTEEHDICCTGGTGYVSGGSRTVFVNGKPLSRVGDAVSPHTGVASISSGSNNVFSD